MLFCAHPGVAGIWICPCVGFCIWPGNIIVQLAKCQKRRGGVTWGVGPHTYISLILNGLIGSQTTMILFRLRNHFNFNFNFNNFNFNLKLLQVQLKLQLHPPTHPPARSLPPYLRPSLPLSLPPSLPHSLSFAFKYTQPYDSRVLHKIIGYFISMFIYMCMYIERRSDLLPIGTHISHYAKLMGFSSEYKYCYDNWR